MEDSKRIQAVLDNLDITFINCKFIYTQLDHGKNGGRRKSTFRNIIDEISGVIKERYENCTFFPGDEEEVQKQISTYETDTMKFKFINCKFVKRNTTIIENMVRKLRRVFGITFELNYITGMAEIDGRKFKIKDIPDIITIVVNKIQDEGV